LTAGDKAAREYGLPRFFFYPVGLPGKQGLVNLQTHPTEHDRIGADLIPPAQPEVEAHLAQLDGECTTLHQPEPRGTGHALAQVPADWLPGHDVLVVHGDQPLFRPETLGEVAAAHERSGAFATLASAIDPRRPDGRVLRAPDGSFRRIVEYRDATPEERAAPEINLGLYCFRGEALGDALARLQPNNAQGELYLTDLFDELRPVEVVPVEDADEALGINDRVQLARAEAALKRRRLEALMLDGVTVVDPPSTFVEDGVRVGRDTVLEPFTILRGTTEIGEDCRVGPHSEITDSVLEDGVRVTHSWLSGAYVGRGSDCGPYAKLRPGAVIGPDVHVGSFAEVVRSHVGSGSAIPHFSYVGDATIGEHVNVAAGTITANFDGEHKNPTVIEDGVFVGVDTMFVAPVRIGRGSKTGAGSVVTKDVPPGSVVVGVPARVVKRVRGESEGGVPQEEIDDPPERTEG
jgi:bifunctional UDP-N-acetylglucosamine pyrophosphorylase/glucosamine-1-phosphate N-acetyltransferase